ncbi:MAG: hypothetical protein NWP95_00355, partial [Pontimonas sp.]|nr:hypothetical protein [Pontimonas sp.]
EEPGGGYGRLVHLGRSVGRSGGLVGPSHVGQIRVLGQHEVREFHVPVVSAGVSLAGRSAAALGGREQLLLPPGGGDDAGAAEGGGGRRTGDFHRPKLPCEVVALDGQDGGGSVGAASSRGRVQTRALTTRGALEDGGKGGESELPCGPAGCQQADAVGRAEPDDGEVVRIIDHREVGGEWQYLCIFEGYDSPYWVDRQGMYNGEQCTCEAVLEEYSEFLASLEEPVLLVPDAQRVRAAGDAKYEVTDEECSQHALWLAGRAREKATATQYAKLWNTVVVKHCRWRDIDPWGLSADDVASLLAWHEMSGHAGEVERLYNAVRVAYAARNKALPQSPLAREIVKGSARVYAEEKRDITRVGFPVHEFVKLCTDRERFRYARPRTGVRDRAVMGLGLRAMKRPIELASFKRRHLQWVPPQTPNWVDPVGAPLGFANKWLKVYVRSQKNDKAAKGQWILIEPTWSASCVCSLMVEYCSEFGVVLGDSEQGDLPLFMSLTQDGKGLSSGAVNALVKKAAGMLGLEFVTGHSLRIGGATAAAAAGLGLEIIRAIGGWFGDSVFRYIQAAAAPALRVSSKMGFG